MVTQSVDTNPEVEKFQISLLRKASVAKKIRTDAIVDFNNNPTF